MSSIAKLAGKITETATAGPSKPSDQYASFATGALRARQKCLTYQVSFGGVPCIYVTPVQHTVTLAIIRTYEQWAVDQ